MDSDWSANNREDEEKQELNSDSEDNENSELSDKASQLKATTWLANIMSSFSVFNQGKFLVYFFSNQSLVAVCVNLKFSWDLLFTHFYLK